MTFSWSAELHRRIAKDERDLPRLAVNSAPRNARAVPASAQGADAMYERFTNGARKAMQLSNQEAQRLNQEYIATEHILLGLIEEGKGIAANVLRELNVEEQEVGQLIDA